MSLFAIRPEFAGAFDATRFVAEDEPSVEAVYRVGSTYFPSSVFEALFAPNHEIPLGASALPGGSSHTKSVGGGQESCYVGANSRGEMLAVKTETGDAPPYHDEGQDAVARPSPPLDSPVRDSPKVTQADITATVKDVLAKPWGCQPDHLHGWRR